MSRELNAGKLRDTTIATIDLALCLLKMAYPSSMAGCSAVNGAFYS